ncbi:MAG TPA: penicillin-insensitive murein endopeptidase, partial [Bdellovibrionota bacterium]|nr:penicillin-insensitive murein endopeptidase [Bdellovibrionota bacterium]
MGRKHSVWAGLLMLPLSSGALPIKQADQAVGFYSKGHLESGAVLPVDGPGFVKLFVARQRWFGTDALVALVTEAAAAIAAEFPQGERLQVGDIAQKGGGQITLHASHQTGLDV